MMYSLLETFSLKKKYSAVKEFKIWFNFFLDLQSVWFFL